MHKCQAVIVPVNRNEAKTGREQGLRGIEATVFALAFL
jgi:hypothetical protein